MAHLAELGEMRRSVFAAQLEEVVDVLCAFDLSENSEIL